VTPQRSADLGDERWPAGTLLGKAVAARLGTALTRPRVAMHREHDHHGGTHGGLKRSRHGEAIEPGQCNIQDDHIWGEFSGASEGFDPVIRFPDDHEIPFVLQGIAQCFAHDGHIVHK
jgi:hypothetical protein